MTSKTANKKQTQDTKDSSVTSEKLDSLLTALQGDLGSIDQESIGEWYELMSKAKDSESKEIAKGLKELDKLVKDKEVSGDDLGELLNHLGELTMDISGENEVKPTLQKIGNQLCKVGRTLAKDEDQQHLQAIDSLVETLGQEPSKIDTESAGESIEHWYEFLHKSEDKKLKAIAGDLKELKKLLKGNKTKASDLSEKLIELGEQTTESAASASKGFKGIVKKLGKALTKFGKSIK